MDNGNYEYIYMIQEYLPNHKYWLIVEYTFSIEEANEHIKWLQTIVQKKVKYRIIQYQKTLHIQ